MRIAMGTMGVLLATSASAQEVPGWSGDIAVTYGRNLGQELNVGGLVGELKKNLGAHVALGARVGGLVGIGVKDDGATGYAGTPVLAKAELLPLRTPVRPLVGVGLGPTFFSAGGVVVAGQGLDTEAAAYGAQGPLFTAMPELGIDLGGLRVAVQHSFLVGSANTVAASVAAQLDQPISDYDVPSLGTTTLQIGGHFGGPKRS